LMAAYSSGGCLAAAETGGLPGYRARHADDLRGEAGGTAERELSGATSKSPVSEAGLQARMVANGDVDNRRGRRRLSNGPGLAVAQDVPGGLV
jgi:hypothetical protein